MLTNILFIDNFVHRLLISGKTVRMYMLLLSHTDRSYLSGFLTFGTHFSQCAPPAPAF
jgi:hypothetical protein